MKSNEMTQLTPMEKLSMVLMQGDLSKLKEEERVFYYNETCKSMGLNPLTRPFEYITLNNKLTLYARKDCTEQLRKIYGISTEKLEKESFDGVFVVTAHLKDRDGKTDVSTGAVSIINLKGEALANAMMKAETKAKRRATLSIVGLGWLDESEIESVPNATVPKATVSIKPEPQVSSPQIITIYDTYNSSELHLSPIEVQRLLNERVESIGTKKDHEAFENFILANKKPLKEFYKVNLAGYMAYYDKLMERRNFFSPDKHTEAELAEMKADEYEADAEYEAPSEDRPGDWEYAQACRVG